MPPIMKTTEASLTNNKTRNLFKYNEITLLDSILFLFSVFKMTQQSKNTLKQLELNAVTKEPRMERTLSKTEFAIIISCILFISLLTFINIIIYAIRK